MKKIIAMMMVGVCMMALAACGKAEQQAKKTTKTTPSQTESPTEEPKTEVKNDNNKIVVYFSATGTTKAVAQKMANVLKTEALEIVPKEKYSSDDLDYSKDDCRANKEMKDENARPEIKNDLSKVAKYDTIYIGFPIWWGTAPRIIQTFFDSNDLSGKTVYLFCTSGGSGIEESVSDLQNAYKDANIVSGQRFAADVSESEISNWLRGLK